MQIQPIPSSATTAWASPLPASSPAVRVQGSAPVVDTVTLSAAAQALLNENATAGASAGVWASDAVKRALGALNDTSGAIVVADKIDAYRMVTGLITDHANFDTDGKRAEASKVVAAYLDSPYAKHLQDVFTNIESRVQSSDDDCTPESLQDTLDAFNRLSVDDQKTFVAAKNTYLGLMGTPGYSDAFASADAYRANLTAQIGVVHELRTALASPAYAPAIQEALAREQRAGEPVEDAHQRRFKGLAAGAEAAGDQRTLDLLKLVGGRRLNDDWTARAEAHVASYGPPPAASPPNGPAVSNWPQQAMAHGRPSSQDLAKAVSLINDDSGKALPQDQVKAYGTVWNYAWNINGPDLARMVISQNMGNSGIYKKVWAAEDRMFSAQTSYFSEMSAKEENGQVLAGEEYVLRALNTLSREDQEYYFIVNGNISNWRRTDEHPEGEAIRYNSLDEYKAGLRERADAATPVLQRVARAKALARAEAGNARISDEQFTLNWMNKLSIEDQKFIFHAEGMGTYSVGGQNGQPIQFLHRPSLGAYKADLKRKADAAALQESARRPAAAKPAKADDHGASEAMAILAGKSGRFATSPGAINAAVALQVLKRGSDTGKA